MICNTHHFFRCSAILINELMEILLGNCFMLKDVNSKTITKNGSLQQLCHRQSNIVLIFGSTSGCITLLLLLQLLHQIRIVITICIIETMNAMNVVSNFFQLQ